MSYEEVMEQAPNVKMLSGDFVKQYIDTVFSMQGIQTFLMALLFAIFLFVQVRLLERMLRSSVSLTIFRIDSFFKNLILILTLIVLVFVPLNLGDTMLNTLPDDVKEWENEYVKPYIKKNNKTVLEDIGDVEVQEEDGNHTVVWNHGKQQFKDVQTKYEDIDEPYISYYKVVHDFTLSDSYREYGSFQEGDIKYPVIHLPS